MISAIFAMCLSVTAQPMAAPDTVVVCPAPFREALKPWVKHRQQQGHRIVIIPTDSSPKKIRESIRLIAKQGTLRNIVLIGDADPRANSDAAFARYNVPTRHVRAEVNIGWNSEPEIATDNWYADLDDDQLPDVTIGRLTADTPEQLSLIVRKIIRYERTLSRGRWCRRINFVAGVGGFGKVIDTAIEKGAQIFISGNIPGSYETTMTYSRWQSPYCPDPRRFHEATIQQLNEGSLFWVYIGHGHRRHLDYVWTGYHFQNILAYEDLPKLSVTSGSPVALILACYAGAFDHAQDCLAEEMLRQRGGPVAIVCGSRVTMPYGMTVLGSELMDQYFQKGRTTLGALLLQAKRETILRKTFDQKRKLLESIAGLLNPGVDLAQERTEHLHLFNLIGDPLLRLARPSKVKLNVTATARPGQTIVVSGNSPILAQGSIELVVRRDRLVSNHPIRNRFPKGVDQLAQFDRAYRQANDKRLLTQPIEMCQGEFHCEIKIPAAATGPCHVRIFLQGKENRTVAIGHADIRILRPRSVSR